MTQRSKCKTPRLPERKAGVTHRSRIHRDRARDRVKDRVKDRVRDRVKDGSRERVQSVCAQLERFLYCVFLC